MMARQMDGGDRWDRDLHGLRLVTSWGPVQEARGGRRSMGVFQAVGGPLPPPVMARQKLSPMCPRIMCTVDNIHTHPFCPRMV